MPSNPLAEVFGFPVGNMTRHAIDHRQGRLCPYHNSSGPNCTKSSVDDPLGVCSILDNQAKAVITCPVRFRQNWMILSDAAQFFFPNTSYVALTEVRLKDGEGNSAGNIDVILATRDESGRVVDFGAVEIQAVYISGTVRGAFKEYMRDPLANGTMQWPRKGYPRPDYLSSSRKRLVPQLLFKGGILQTWHKKMAVVVQHSLFKELPTLRQVPKEEAEIAWLIYHLKYDQGSGCYNLERDGVQYTEFGGTLDRISKPVVSAMAPFIASLEQRIRQHKTLGQPVGSSLEPIVEPLDHDLLTNMSDPTDNDNE